MDIRDCQSPPRDSGWKGRYPVLTGLFSFAVLAAFSLAAKPAAEEITDALKAQDWAKANALLIPYMKEHPEQKWTYSSRSWALWHLKQYEEALTVARAGMARFGADDELKRPAAAALAELALSLPLEERPRTLLESLDLVRRDYVLYRLAVQYRELKRFTDAEKTLLQGAAEFPEYKHFAEALSYTRYLWFKASPADTRSQFADRVVEWLDPSASPSQQEHYWMILHAVMRNESDRARFENLYGRIFSKLPDSPRAYDEYGFTLYTAFRVHGRESGEILARAVEARRKAHSLFWKSKGLPAPVQLNSFPLRGRHAVWSSFSGKAMTHNGFAAYCYDFAAVDGDGSPLRKAPGTALQDYLMYGHAIFAAADGVVQAIVDGNPDNAPGGYAHEANAITIDHGTFYSFAAHLRPGSFRVREGQKVRAGDVLAEVGNSGMSSQPHLHFCVYGRYDEWISIPFRFPAARVHTDGKSTVTTRPLNEGEIVEID